MQESCLKDGKIATQCEKPKRAVVSVATLSHVGYCLTLFQSLIAANPGLDCICCLLDMTAPDKKKLEFEITGGCHGIQNVQFVGWPTFSSKGLREARHYFNSFELSCAAKMSAIRYALDGADYAEVIYLDSDLYCTANLDSVYTRFLAKDVILTPHFFKPQAFDGNPSNDYSIMQAGFMNAGFIAVKRTEIVRTIIDWLENRVLRYGFNAFHASLFVDQKWVSLLPLYFPGHVEVCSDAGVNVGHWNIAERPLEEIEGVIYAKGEPLRLFHFSGFDPKTPQILTKHLHRAPSEKSKVYLLRLCQEYALLVEKMAKVVSKWNVDLPLPQTPITEKINNYENVFRGAANESLMRKIAQYSEAGPTSFGEVFKKAIRIIYRHVSVATTVFAKHSKRVQR